jgi:hypothetical protein
VGECAEDQHFLRFGGPAHEEARIAPEELKAALEGDEDRRPLRLDLCLRKGPPRRTDMPAGTTMHAPAALPR